MNVFAKDLLAGQVALVTGGGTGIGWAISQLMGQLGARVAIASRKEEHLRAAEAQFAGAGMSMLARTCDIREPEQVQSLVDAVVDRWGRLDILVNNAGGQFPSSAESLSPKGWDAVIRNNLNGTWYVTQAVGTRAMIPARRGRIVNVIANIERGFPGMVHTGAARAGVENMTKTLAVEWAPYQIAVNAVAPGVIQTDAIAQYGEFVIEMARKKTPLKRLGQPKEVADAVVFLASQAASFITGATLYIDGGACLWGETWPIPEPTASANGG